jgi:hypothetical protein
MHQGLSLSWFEFKRRVQVEFIQQLKNASSCGGKILALKKGQAIK